MSGFIKGEARSQATLFPEALDDYVTEENPIRVIDVFVDSLDFLKLRIKTIPSNTGRPAYHPETFSRSLAPNGHLRISFLVQLGALYDQSEQVAGNGGSSQISGCS